jgi:uncharacterized integral membrane protein
MKLFANFLISCIVAIWVVAIAIISVQNATPVTLQLFIFRSIELPFGLVLAFSAGAGMLALAVAQPLLISGSQRYSEYEDFDEEDF